MSFKHHGFLHASKRPKFPSLYRLRPDLTWDTVVNNWNEQKNARSGLHSIPFPLLTNNTAAWPIISQKKGQIKPKGYWNDIKNWRKYFIEYADESGFNPLLTENWDAVTASQIKAKKVHVIRPDREEINETFAREPARYRECIHLSKQP